MTKTSIEYIALKSKELLVTQINSYRSLHQKAGTVIAISALFAPLFLFLVEKAQLWVRISAALLIIPLIIGVILLLRTLKATKLSQGYDETNFEDLMNKKIADVHKFEISYNKYSIEQNDKILIQQNKKYNNGITLILIAIIFSIGLIITDTISNNKPNNKSKTKCIMADDEKTTPSNSDKKEEKKETLPKVDPTKVKQLNEGVDPKKTSKKGK